jgi:hypothetical protein
MPSETSLRLKASVATPNPYDRVPVQTLTLTLVEYTNHYYYGGEHADHDTRELGRIDIDFKMEHGSVDIGFSNEIEIPAATVRSLLANAMKSAE